VGEIFCAYQRPTIRVVAEDVGIEFGKCHKILTEELQMRCMSVKFVAHFLMVEQKDVGLSVCTDFCERAQNDPKFMSSVIIGDKSWVHGYDPETKQMSSQWKIASSRPKKV
jgi:hypothetical protein